MRKSAIRVVVLGVIPLLVLAATTNAFGELMDNGAVDLGGAGVTLADGTVFMAQSDAMATGGLTLTPWDGGTVDSYVMTYTGIPEHPIMTDDDVVGTTDPAMKSMLRSAIYSWDGAFYIHQAVPNGVYDVTLYALEGWSDYGGGRTIGISGDITGTINPQLFGHWTALTARTAEVTDGQIDILVYSIVELSTISGISWTAVPEPTSLGLLATGLIGLLAYAWRKRK